jgi:hypothetical protein
MKPQARDELDATGTKKGCDGRRRAPHPDRGTGSQPDHRRRRHGRRDDDARGDVFDAGTGRIANATFGGYLIPTNADVAAFDVAFPGARTRRGLGIKGIGEIGVVGVSARHRQRRLARHRPTHQIICDHR